MLETGKILPLKVLVKEIKKPEKEGNIYIPSTAKFPTIAGEVVLIGDSTATVKMVVEKGDKILHGPNSFATVEIEGIPYRLLNQVDILFIWK